MEELNSLPRAEQARVVEKTLRQLTAEERKPIERLLRRLQHPEVPESFWQGVEDHEEGRTVDMETALRETPPRRK
jgi:alkylated DNA nucleotide flippase Atl1